MSISGLQDLPGREIRYFSFGRHALLTALQLLGIGPGDKVLLPAFICRDLLAPVHSVGAQAVFYDVSAALAPLALPPVADVKAVLAVNYFGFPQSLQPFRDFCAETGASLIEDNAHGLFSRDADGNLLGTRGDLGIFSMRKSLLMPGGGALVVNNLRLAAMPIPEQAVRDDGLSRAFRAKQALAALQRNTGWHFRSHGEAGIRLLRRLVTGNAVPPADPESETVMPAVAGIHAGSLQILGEADAASEVARRRACFLSMRDSLVALGVTPVFPELPAGAGPYGYPFYADATQAAQATAIARRAGFDCIHWPDLPTAIRAQAHAHYRNLWLVNFLW